MEQLGIDFDAAGSVMSKSELEELRRKRGECITCGRKCFQKKLFKMIPITDHGRVLNGRCLNCKPLDATENGLIPAVSRPATKEDLARFSRSQSQLGLSGPGVRPPSAAASVALNRRQQPSGRSYSGSESSNRSLNANATQGTPNRASSIGRPDSASNSANMDNSSRILDSSRRSDMENSSRSGERLRMSYMDSDPRSVTPSSSSRELDAASLGIDGQSMHSLDRRQMMGVGDSHLGDEYAAGGRGIHDDLPRTAAQISGMSVNEESGYGNSARHREERGIPRSHIDDSSNHSPPHARNGMLNRGGEVDFSNNPQRNNYPPHSSRTMSSISSAEDDMVNGRMHSHKRFVPPNDALYEEDAIDRHSSRSHGSLSAADERAIDQLHNSNGDPAEILAVMSENLSSPLVQSYALKEISCLHLGPEDQDRLVESGAMELITTSMRAYPMDIELQIHGCRAIWNGSGTPDNQLAFVDAGALDIILADMDQFIANAEVQECAMGTLSNLAASEGNLLPLIEKGTVSHVVEAMNKHSDNSLVQGKGCSAITNMASHLSPLKKNIMDMGGGGAVVICMVMHPDDHDLQEKALRALKNLSSNSDQNKIELANIGGIDAVITAMQVHRDHAGVQEAGAWTLSNLASNNENKAVIGDCGGIDVVIRAMWVHADNVKVQEWCCRALYTFSLDRHNSELILQVGGIAAIVSAMQAHVDSAAVQEMGCAVLCNLAFDESSKMRIVDEEALDAIVLAMVLFADDAKVQESACEVLLALAIVENYKSMQASNIGELARNAAAKFPENCQEAAIKLIDILDSFSGY